MIGKFRNAIYSALGVDEEENVRGNEGPLKFPYRRPCFLCLESSDEVAVCLDHGVRPILVSRSALPWCSGYGEAVNGGKSSWNEDQACVHGHVSERIPCLSYTYFALFDGHAGSHVAVSASLELHQILHSRLMEIAHHFEGSLLWEESPESPRRMSEDSLIIGALESAFWDMDHAIGQDKLIYNMSGGSTALVALFIIGKLYVANAGDSRALLCRKSESYPMSFDFTPVSERQRLQKLSFLKPHLLGSEYTRLDYFQRPMEKNLGQNMLYRLKYISHYAKNPLQITIDDWNIFVSTEILTLDAYLNNNIPLWDVSDILFYYLQHLTCESLKCNILAKTIVTHSKIIHYSKFEDCIEKYGFYRNLKDAHMTGWAYKKISHHDLKFPVVYGEGKRSRLLATIGVTRGFGDHELRAQSKEKSNVLIKPFLTSQPEVRVLDIVNSCSNVDENDILILGTDGLWDVVSNEEVSKIVADGINATGGAEKEDNKYKYVTIAQELVMSARGKLSESGWKKYDNTSATIDDISVFVIPVKGYKDEYEKYND